MSNLLSEVNVGGNNYGFAGSIIKGTCASAADSWVKQVDITDGYQIREGMLVSVKFTYGNTVGNAIPVTLYSSDQINYYTDAAMTQLFTLAPEANREITYTGHNNVYTYYSFPVIYFGKYVAKLKDSRGHYAGKGCFNAGDKIVFFWDGEDASIQNSNVREVTSAYTVFSDGSQVYNVSQVNGALANLDSLTYTGSGTTLDLNDTDLANKYVVISQGCTVSNLPSSYSGGQIYEGYVKTIFIFGKDNTQRLYQELSISYYDDGWKQYKATRYRIDNTWLAWEQVTTSSVLTGALANYEKITAYTNENVDADNLTTEGIYIFKAGYSGTTTGLPSWNKDGGANLVVKSLSGDGTYSTQIFYRYNEIPIFRTRLYNSGVVWSDWQELATTSALANYLKQYSISAKVINTDSIFDLFGMGSGSLLGFRMTQLHANYLYFAIGHIYRFDGGYRIVNYNKSDAMNFTFNETTGSLTSNYALDCVFFPQIANI